MFEGLDFSAITTPVAAVALAFWAMKYFIPTERKAYQELLKADREAWANEREANQKHVQGIVETFNAELETTREERRQERQALERVIRVVLVALAQGGHDVNGALEKES